MQNKIYKPDDDWKYRNTKDGKVLYDPQKLLPAPSDRPIEIIAPPSEKIFNDAEQAQKLGEQLDVLDDYSIPQIQIAMFLAMPTIHRPQYKKMSEFTGVCERTIYNWQNLPRIQELKMKILKVYMLRSAPDVLRAISEQAKLGCTKSAKMMLEAMGVVEKDDQKSQGNTYIIMSNDQVSEKVAHLRKLEQIARVRAKEIPVEMEEITGELAKD